MMGERWNVEDLRWKGEAFPVHKRPRKKVGGRFLRGPIPVPWLVSASGLPGKALHVGILIWYLSGLSKSKPVTLARQAVEQFSLARTTAWRGLRELERAGLVVVERRGMRAPRVSLLMPREQ
jgi:hypothetical protein